MTLVEIHQLVRGSIDRQLKESFAAPPSSYSDFKHRLVDALALCNEGTDRLEIAHLVHESDDVYAVWHDIEAEMDGLGPKDAVKAWNSLAEHYVPLLDIDCCLVDKHSTNVVNLLRIG